jgi:hypothetical protein
VDSGDTFGGFVEGFDAFRGKVVPDSGAEDELDDLKG